MRSLSIRRLPQKNDVVVATTPEPSGLRRTEVMIQVAASSINGSDLGLLRSRGAPALLLRLSRPGFDVAGQVVECGSEVTAFQVGDRVMGLLSLRGGGQTERVAVAQQKLILIPAQMSDVDAAAIPLAGLTALQALRGRGRLQAGGGQRVLVIGAAGGIGSFAVQLATMLGAQVTAVTSRNRRDYGLDLGADTVIERQEWERGSTGTGYDIILDVPGRLRFRESRALLSERGVHVSTSPVSVDTACRLRVAGSGKRVTAVTTSPSPQDLTFLTRLVEEKRMWVPVDAVFPLSRAEEAYAHAQSGNLRGKVVLTLAPERQTPG